MKRRSYLKNILTVSGGLIALPSWATSWNIITLKTYISSFTKIEQDLLAAIADTIIPVGDSVGAKTVGVDQFLQKLFEHCYEKEINDNLKKQMAAIEAKAQSLYATSFTVCTQSQREALLLEFSNSAVKDEKDFYNLLKSETIRGFSTSELVMTKYLNYKIAPGYYYGCVTFNF